MKTKKDKTQKKKAKVVDRPIDIDFANRDNISASVQMNTKLTAKDAMLIASILIELKQLLVKQWNEMKDIRDEHFGGKLKFNIPCVVDCTEEPETVKVKLAVPRPALKDSAETTTVDPEQPELDTVSNTIAIRTAKEGNVETQAEHADAFN